MTPSLTCQEFSAPHLPRLSGGQQGSTARKHSRAPPLTGELWLSFTCEYRGVGGVGGWGGRFPDPSGVHTALIKWHFDELSINELETLR